MHKINQMAEFAVNTTSLQSEKQIDVCAFVGRSTFCIPLGRTNYGPLKKILDPPLLSELKLSSENSF